MHSLWSRINAIFFFAVSALFAAACASAVTTLWLPHSSSIDVVRIAELKTLRSMRDPTARGAVTDRAVFTFDVQADLRGVWNWNVKQLFAFVTADFAANGGNSSVVVWDRVLQSRDASLLDVRGAHVKYPLMDQGKSLRSTAVALTLRWDVMPITGLLRLDGGGRGAVRLPEAYCADAECVLTPLDA